jgi:soluble lytic murein transglycosylase
MLDRNSGNLEQTLAAYNAGPARAAEWVGWNTYREPAEFVESIPYTETRDYVQAVIRNADIYRRLYPEARP